MFLCTYCICSFWSLKSVYPCWSFRYLFLHSFGMWPIFWLLVWVIYCAGMKTVLWQEHRGYGAHCSVKNSYCKCILASCCFLPIFLSMIPFSSVFQHAKWWEGVLVACHTCMARIILCLITAEDLLLDNNGLTKQRGNLFGWLQVDFLSELMIFLYF